MAFGVASAGSSLFNAGANVTNTIPSETGPDLEEIQTEAIGFQSIAGETRLRITPPWPADALPPPTASLLSVASHKGLLAAAGPSSVIIANTGSIRQGFSTLDSVDGNTKHFTPQLTLDIGMRISQIAFSADENRLVISAENGGGLAVYSVQALLEGNRQAEFELSTNGNALRSMLANPTPEKAELFAIVTTNGELMMANLNTRQFLDSAQGQTLRHGVSCISWSARGKQLVAGLGNGTCFQMTPEGEVKAEIPRPDTLLGDQHVATISWLENNLFLINHTLSSFDPDTPPSCTFHLVTRLVRPQNQPQNSFIFQKLPDPCFTNSTKRSPPYCFIHRLREFPPNLQDLIVVASTASPDVGMFTRSNAPLIGALPPETITNVFTTTFMANDARRANLPMIDLNDTSPVGVAFDLSSQEKVKRPLPGEEMEESPGPLPGLMILNDDGVLSFWWLVYTDSIRQNTIYPGLVHGGVQRQPQQLLSSETVKSAPSFGQAGFGGTSFSNNAGTSLNRSPVNSFGATNPPNSSISSTFGASSGLGKPQSPWGNLNSNPATSSSAVPTFGQPAFGSSTINGGSSQGIKFGTAGGIGNRVSPWAAPNSGSVNAQDNSFGQSSVSNTQGGSPFGSAGGNVFGASKTGGFASFATAPGFAASAAQSGGESIFTKSTPGVFGTGMDTETSFGGSLKNNEENSGDLFSGQGFTLGSTFKGDGTAKNDLPKSDGKTSNSFFGGTFGKTLGESQTNPSAPPILEAEMNDSVSNDEGGEGSPIVDESMTPAAKSDLSKFQFPSTTPPLNGGLFGTQAQNTTTPAAVQESIPATSSFERPAPTAIMSATASDGVTPISSLEKPTSITTTPKETPKKPPEVSRISIETPTSHKVKLESEEEQLALSEIPKITSEAPLPPESTSKASYAAGDTSSSSKSSAEDAPLPPDFLPSKSKFKDLQPPITEDPLPPDDGDDGLDDDEGSGVDVAQEISPITDSNQSPKITPESSFGASFDKSPVGGLFTQVSRQQPMQSAKNLFGEISSTSIPSFLPPSKIQESPRSPSPVRAFAKVKNMGLRPDNARSVSAPGYPPKIIAHRKLASSQAANDSLEQRRKQERELLAAKQAQLIKEEEQELSDREDEKVREELEREVEPTKILEPFLAHQDYVGEVSKPGIPGQIEAVYRDVNSMIDTLGLNARSLKAFMKGHKELYQNGGRSREDLEQGNWCLFEINDLGGVESKLFEQLEEGRIMDIQEKLGSCQNIRKELHKVRSKHHEIANIIQSRSEPNTDAMSSSLTPEQYTIQHNLRAEFLQVQQRIAEAEEGISTLGILIASSEPTRGQNGNSKKPTVEAVTNTIQKMTSIVEKKSRDMDVLETHLQALRLAPSAAARRSESRDPSPSTPANPKSSWRKSTTSARRKDLGYGPHNRLRTSLQVSDGASAKSSPRKKMDAFTDEEVERWRAKGRYRRDVNELIRKVFLDGGPRIQMLD